jgi:hypothetical protein
LQQCFAAQAVQPCPTGKHASALGCIRRLPFFLLRMAVVPDNLQHTIAQAHDASG